MICKVMWFLEFQSNSNNNIVSINDFYLIEVISLHAVIWL